jgi:predicted nuclease of predicted toxin-antitoxin system
MTRPAIKYLADENVASRIVAWLRNRGDDVRHAAEERPGELDIKWLHEAEAEERLILTSDKDFGDLVFRDRLNSHGVVLLRLKNLSVDERLHRLEQCWSVVEANSIGCFIVITPHRVRVRRIVP